MTRMGRLPLQQMHPGAMRTMVSQAGTTSPKDGEPSGKPSRIRAVRCPASSTPAIAASRRAALGPVTSVTGMQVMRAATDAGGKRWRAEGSDVLLAELAGLDAQLLELAVEVGALQSGFFGNPGHAATFACQVMLEIGALESIARFAQGQVE